MAYLLPRKQIFGKAAIFLSLGTACVPARAQTLGLAPAHEVSVWRIIGALLFCCILGVVGAFALRYRMRGRTLAARGAGSAKWRNLIADLGIRTKPASEGARRLKLLETVRLGYQVDVNLLECDGHPVVIVTSPHGAFVARPDATHETGKPS